MEEVRQLVQEEGREARNIVAFHVAVDTPVRVARKPPRSGAPPPRRLEPRTAARLRSASAGRDKRSELRARYWALLFGDLQRAVGEIYNTVEAHENQNECQEVILVLENYTRDFKALGEWFRLKWEYDNTPPPQRPQSLAWEIRKTDFVRPESRRTHSVRSSPSVSGKNSPSLSGHNTPSGKNSPNLTGKASPGSGKISPRISGHSNTSPKGSVEFFSNKIVSKSATKPEAKVAKETRLSDIKEKDFVANEDKEKEDKKEEKVDDGKEKDAKEQVKPLVEIGKAKESANVTPKPVVVKTSKRGKPTMDEKKTISDTELSSQAKATVAKLEAMENDFLAKQLVENAAKNENLANQDIEKEQIIRPLVSETNQTAESGSSDKNKATSGIPTKPEDNVTNVARKISKPCDEKSITITNIDEAKPNTDSNVVPVAETKVKAVTAKKKSASSASKKKTVLKQIKETFPKDTKVSEAKDKKDTTLKVSEAKEKKDTNKKVTKEVKLETVKKDDSLKDKIDDTILNGAGDYGKEIKETEDAKSIVNEDAKKEDGKKTESKSPEPNNVEFKDGKKEDKDSKKAEIKPTDTKLPAKPAYSQAAAKPKLVTAKDEIKPPNKTLYRSKTSVEIRSSSASNRQMKQFPNRNPKSKCSYPFNLTTGRTSLFDMPGTPKVIATKKPINRPQLASGDARNHIKPDVKTTPPRPDSLKVNGQGDNEEKTNAAFEKIKDYDEYSSSDTMVTQVDLSRIESSESLKTIVPDGFDVANSIEVLNIDGEKTDNEGWLTVKSRRLSRESKKSKSHWANRFHQPSATTSLPTLNMIESPKSETNPIVDSKLDRAKSEQPQNKPEEVVKVAANNEIKTKDTSMIRQKSDVTGLKTRSSRNKALKKDKNRDRKDSELTKNRLHSSLESLTTGLARSQESTEQEAFDFDKWKVEFRTTFKYLDEDDQMTDHNEILKAADPSEMSEIAEMTSQIEENERKISLALDFQSEADQKKLSQEEDLLNRQIMELQQVSDIDLDTETDDTETDAEILCEDAAIVPCNSTDSRICRDLASCIEHHYESALEGMSWSERVDMLGVLEELVARDPGRAQQLHAKLSQGIKRRGSLQDVLRKLQAKQARAEKQRKELHTERAKKIHQLLARVEEVKMAKNQLIEEKRNRMERRLQKAAENRDQHLKDIVRKAHDEEEKLREIAFIKQLEAENRRHEVLEHCRANTTRLRQMRRERLDKLEQKSLREAAVGARRAALEAARQRRVESLLERRAARDARRDQLAQQRRRERGDAAREKAEGVKSRLSALAAAAEQETDALRERIRDKQDASQQRLESHLQAIREKATTGPRQPTTSESQDQASSQTKEQDDEIERLEQERKEKERQKIIRKKARKLKQKILSSSKEGQLVDQQNIQSFLSPTLGKMQRVVHQLYNMIAPIANPDYKPAGDDKRRQKTESVEKEDFKYDFEDKMGKKKKKKKAHEKNTQKGQDAQNDPKKKNDKNGQDAQKKKDEPKSDLNETKQEKKSRNKIESQNDAQKNDDSKKEGVNDDVRSVRSVNETQKLSKSNSICSSVSDMSKASCKIERPELPINIPQLEKLIGELFRMTASKDCNDNLKPKTKLLNVTIFTKLHTVKTFGYLFGVIAEREDLLAQLSQKSLAMAVSTTSRVMLTCKPTALYFFSTPSVLHAITLLNYQLGRDLSDSKEMELAKQLADLVSVSLDAALCETRSRNCEGDENAAMGAVRARAHNLISYLCLSGCIARAEHAGEARERVQTLVTLCADLCQAHKTDAGPERLSALQSLRCALGTGLMGSRAEFCMLFAEGAELSRSQNFVRAARTTHLLRQLAELDHLIVQDAFGEGGWPLEFRAAVARLLSQHAPNDKEAPPSCDVLHLSNTRLELTLSEQMVLDLIVLVGFVIVNNPQLQETICENWGVIKTLCTLPANWLVSEYHSHSLLPTLLVLADRQETANVIFSELSVKMLESYMNCKEARNVKLVQVMRAAKEKAAKKEKLQQGKKDKQQDTEDKQNSGKNVANGHDSEADLTNGNAESKENGVESYSDTESVDDEV